MKVELEEMFFNTVELGKTFLYDGNAYIKTSFCGRFTAVRFEDGQQVVIDSGETVVPISLKVVVDNG